MNPPGARLLIFLVAGRSLFRLVMYGSAALLLPVWGTDAYGGYASAAGAFFWLTALTSTGPEKAALNLLARARRTHRPLLGAVLAFACGMSLPPAAAFAVAAVVARPATPTLYLGLAAVAVALGANALLVGLLRVTGRPKGDAVNYVLLAVAYGLVTVTTVVGGLWPLAYVTGQLVALTVANLVLVALLGVPGVRARPGLLRLLAGTALLMGASELGVHAAMSALFVELTLTGWPPVHAAALYLADIGWSAGVTLMFYVFRIFQPGTALRLAAGGAPAALRRAHGLAGWAAGWSACWTAGWGLALPTLDGYGLPPLLAAMLVTKAPGFLLLNLAVFTMENADARSLRVTALGSLLGMAAVVLLGALLVPALGAPGAICAAGAMEAIQAATILRGRRSSPPVDR